MNNPIKIVTTFLALMVWDTGNAQPAFISDIFQQRTQFIKNIPYAKDTIKKHLLDIYLPQEGTNFPLVIWVHGGGWRTGDKYADMGYMKSTLKNLIDKGYAIACIDYSQSTSKNLQFGFVTGRENIKKDGGKDCQCTPRRYFCARHRKFLQSKLHLQDRRAHQENKGERSEFGIFYDKRGK